MILEATTLFDTPQYSNIIAMEALKHGRGKYTSKEIKKTLETAITGFIGAKVESYQQYSESYKDSNKPLVCIHTGNWGCGAFGGNVSLMCLIQIFAARIAGIDELYYHLTATSFRQQCAKAAEIVEQLIQQITKGGGK